MSAFVCAAAEVREGEIELTISEGEIIKYLQFQISYLKVVDWYDGKVKDAKQSVKIETALLSGNR